MKGEREVAGIRCGAVLAFLSEYLDGEGTAKQRAQVDAHLAGCDVCARFGGEIGAMVAAVRRSVEPETLPEDMEKRLRDRLGFAGKDGR